MVYNIVLIKLNNNNIINDIFTSEICDRNRECGHTQLFF